MAYNRIKAMMGAIGAQTHLFSPTDLMRMAALAYAVPYDDDPEILLLYIEDARGKTKKEVSKYLQEYVYPFLMENWDDISPLWNGQRLLSLLKEEIE